MQHSYSEERHKIRHIVIQKLLNTERVLPGPDRRTPKGVLTRWRKLIAAYAENLVATNFFCKRIWTTTGVFYAYMLMVIHIGSRNVCVSPTTFTSDAN